MTCTSCQKRREKYLNKIYDVLGRFKNAPVRQLNARLETFKKNHCRSCDSRYNCDLDHYKNCTKKST